MSPNPPSQAAIARALGLSKASITKLKGQGMPVSSVAAARRWRDANLCFDGRRKEVNLGEPQPDPSPAEFVERVNALMPVAQAAVQAGRFDLVEAELRQLLREIPDALADQVSMSMAVWDALTADVRRVLDEMAAAEGFQEDGTPVSEEDAEWMGAFWMAAARGMVRRTETGLTYKLGAVPTA